ncbi:MAG: DUF1570 domain-containing protein [Planctomycetia bacterium]|nr:DUF1570 domain-containing protein [Planctomycetia bacterium]
MTAALLGLLLLGQPAPMPVIEWKLDELIAVNGARYRGLVLDQSDKGVRFRVVRRPPGRSAVTFTSFFLKHEVARIEKISDADRAALKIKLAELDPTGSGERKRMEGLELTAAEWLGAPNAAKRYDAEQFILVSSASEEITRRAAVRLEQIFIAYGRFLPPRVRPAADKPLTVYLAPDKTEYAKLLVGLNGPILNPAIYDPVRNRITCGTDLRRLGQDLTAARVHNVQQLATIDQYEADVRRLYKDSRTERDRHLATVAEQRKKIWDVEAANETKFNETTARLFALLYHESFHAYVTTFVYPPMPPADVKAGKGTGELPRWLNEGLAQIFETAILDGGELRVGHADRDRLQRFRDLRAKGGVPAVAELNRVGGESFLASHTVQKAMADRMYLGAWAVAYHLVFERRLFGTPELDRYLTTINSGGDPGPAFQKLVGKTLAEYDAELADYFQRLRPDGTLEATK